MYALEIEVRVCGSGRGLVARDSGRDVRCIDAREMGDLMEKRRWRDTAVLRFLAFVMRRYMIKSSFAGLTKHLMLLL